MIKLKETSRLGRKLKERTGSTTVGSASDEPACAPVWCTPRVRMELSRPWRVNYDVLAAFEEDPRYWGAPSKTRAGRSEDTGDSSQDQVM